MQGGKPELLSERAANRSWALKRQNAGLKDGAADFPTSKKGLKSADRQKQKRRGLPFGNPLLKAAATYSPTVRSTIGDAGLNFSVRNGKRWSPGAIAT